MRVTESSTPGVQRMTAAPNAGSIRTHFSAFAERAFRVPRSSQPLVASLTAPTRRNAHIDNVEGTSMKLSDTVLIPAAKVLLLVASATAGLFILSDTLATINLVSVIYLLPVLLAALWWGTWPALLAAFAGAAAADFFFYPPLYSFWISDTQNIADLVGFVIVGLACGNLASGLRRRELEMQDLYRFSRRLAACFTTADLVRATQDYLSDALGRPALLIESARVEDAAATEVGVPRSVRSKAQAIIAGREPADYTTIDPATRHAWLLRPVALGSSAYVIFVDLGSAPVTATRHLKRRIDAILADATHNLMRLDLTESIEEFKLQAQAETLNNALLASISHDFRNPLVAIFGAASVLDQIAAIRQDTRASALVETVRDEALRLDDNIKNLAKAVSIKAGGERSSVELSDPVAMVRAAIELKRTQLAGHKVEVTLAPDLPLVRVRSALIENALAQLLDNAAKYASTGSTVEIRGSIDGDWLVLSVTDQGIGLTPDERSRVGQRAFRGTRHADAISGSGLGLWIANTFVAANGGRIAAESAGPGLGTTVSIFLPVTPQSA